MNRRIVVEAEEQHGPLPEPEKRTEEAEASNGGDKSITKDTVRWAEVQTGQFGIPVNTFEWSEVSLDQHYVSEKSR